MVLIEAIISHLIEPTQESLEVLIISNLLLSTSVKDLKVMHAISYQVVFPIEKASCTTI
jgi:hypothetical protein